MVWRRSLFKERNAVASLGSLVSGRSTFSHKSYRQAPELCLAAFDELKEIGLEAFTKRHDPYWDLPLNESLPKPVIELPINREQGSGSREQGSDADLGPLFEAAARREHQAEKNDQGDAVPIRSPFPVPRSPAFPVPRSPIITVADPYDVIAALLDKRGVITSGDAQQATGLDAAGVRPYLQRLVDEGRAVTEGQRRGMKYRRAGG
jgi:hypothetical protein